MSDTFTVRPEHVALLRAASWRYDDEIEFGGPAVDFKRPFGNSGGIYEDMREALGPEYSDFAEGVLDTLWRETAAALRFMLQFGDFRPGRYVFQGGEWRRAPSPLPDDEGRFPLAEVADLLTESDGDLHDGIGANIKAARIGEMPWTELGADGRAERIELELSDCEAVEKFRAIVWRVSE